MKKILLVISLFSILTLTLKAQGIVLEKIEGKTWLENDGFAGTNIVFYKTANGLLKAIRQINGSGVPVVSSGIYDIEIKQDTIYLYNGLNLKTSEKLGDYIYTYNAELDRISRSGESLNLLAEESILYAWIDKRINVHTQIDVKLLTEIFIEKNKIYEDNDLIITLINQ